MDEVRKRWIPSNELFVNRLDDCNQYIVDADLEEASEFRSNPMQARQMLDKSDHSQCARYSFCPTRRLPRADKSWAQVLIRQETW